MSQDFELAKQEKIRQEVENIEMQSRIESLEETLRSRDVELERSTRNCEESRARLEKFEEAEGERKTREGAEEALRGNLAELEEQLNDKNKVYLSVDSISRASSLRLRENVFTTNVIGE